MSLSHFQMSISNRFRAYFVPLERMCGAREKRAQTFFSSELDNNFYQAFLSLVITQPFQYPFQMK